MYKNNLEDGKCLQEGRKYLTRERQKKKKRTTGGKEKEQAVVITL
jgi:hypothetical protein